MADWLDEHKAQCVEEQKILVEEEILVKCSLSTIYPGISPLYIVERYSEGKMIGPKFPQCSHHNILQKSFALVHISILDESLLLSKCIY